MIIGKLKLAYTTAIFNIDLHNKDFYYLTKTKQTYAI